ncbi:MAG TPA: arylsulfotransferase family protein [Acidobacteriota bacterium]|nr:arylsulfotransferase family protein [Acidobacteriota bacterium]
MKEGRESSGTKRLILTALVLAIVAFAGWLVWAQKQKRAALDYAEQSKSLLTSEAQRALKQGPRKGRWNVVRTKTATGNLPADTAEDLRAQPYLQGYQKAPEQSGVTLYDPKLAENGLNFCTSGHAPEAYLMDMQGKPVYRWHYEFEQVWPDVPQTVESGFWRRAHLNPDGSILAIFEGEGLFKLDRDSKLQWVFRDGCHHEAFVTPDQKIYVLTRKKQNFPNIKSGHDVLVDGIAVLNQGGKLLDEYSILECVQNSSYASLVTHSESYDLFHANSIYVFDGSLVAKSPLFAKGNVLVSLCYVDAIAILNPQTRKVIWAEGKSGLWRRQHDATLTPDGNILLFDNQGRNGKSRVLEYDLSKQRIGWEFGKTAELDSQACGIVQLLPNGNRLITESESGRALEVTPDGNIVWEYYNPYRAGDHRELIATLFEVRRFPASFAKWLPANQH